MILAVVVLAAAQAHASLPDATKAWLDKNSKTITKLFVSGGTSSVDDATVQAATPKLASFTGTVKIQKKDGTIIEVTSDGKTPPPALAEGDKVTVVSGEATVTVGGNTASLKSGDAVSVTGNSITVVTGTVSVSNSKGVVTQVAAGKSVTTSPPASVSSNQSNNQNPTNNNNSTGNAQQEQQTSSTLSPSTP